MRTQSTFNIEIPTGWGFKESVEVRSDDGLANFIVSSEPVDEGTDSGEYAARQRTLLKYEVPEFLQHSFERISLDAGENAWLLLFEWLPAGSARVTQLQMYIVQQARAYTATATARSSDFATFEPVFERTLKSLVVTGATAGIRVRSETAPRLRA